LLDGHGAAADGLLGGWVWRLLGEVVVVVDMVVLANRDSRRASVVKSSGQIETVQVHMNVASEVGQRAMGGAVGVNHRCLAQVTSCQRQWSSPATSEGCNGAVWLGASTGRVVPRCDIAVLEL
jgi:hypothetical protein